MTSIRINGTARLVEWIDLNFVKKKAERRDDLNLKF